MGVPTIRLENTTPSPVTLIFPHAQACSEDQGCLCLRQRVTRYDHNGRTGETTPRAKAARIPGSAQLFGAGHAASMSGPLPSTVLRAPDVVRALRMRTIKVVTVAAPAAPAATDVVETPPLVTNPVEAPVVEPEPSDSLNDSPRRKRA